MTISNYSVSDQSTPESQKDSEHFVESQHHNFVTIIPVEYPRLKFPNPSYSNQNLSSQEDIRNQPFQVNDKDPSELSSMASVSTQSSHFVNRGTGASLTPLEKPANQRIPNGQGKFILCNLLCFRICFSSINCYFLLFF